MISKLCTSDYGGGGSGGGCGKMVSVLAFYSDNLSSNFVEDYVFKFSEKNENNKKRPVRATCTACWAVAMG